MSWDESEHDDTLGPVGFLFVLFVSALVTYLMLLVVVLAITGCRGVDVGVGRPEHPQPWLHEPPGESELEPR